MEWLTSCLNAIRFNLEFMAYGAAQQFEVLLAGMESPEDPSRLPRFRQVPVGGRIH